MVKQLKLVFITLIFSTLLACGGEDTTNNADKKPKKEKSSYLGKKVYRHSMDGAPTTLDPVRAAVVYSNFVVQNVFDTLYSYKYLARPYELKPNLATTMPQVSEDGLTYTIKIKQGVRFQDHEAFAGGKGREVHASDFIYSIQRHFDKKFNSQGAWVFAGRIVGLDDWKKNGSDYSQTIAGLQAPDAYTIQIKLVKPYPQLIYTLAMGFSAIVPHEAVEFYGDEFGSNPVGSGPFALQSFNQEKAILVTNPNFRKEPLDLEFEGYDESKHGFTGIKVLAGKSPPFIDIMEVNFVKEPASRWNSFTKGNEIQYTTVPKDKTGSVLMSKKQPLKLFPQYADTYHHMFMVEAGFVYSGFDMANPTFGSNGDPVHDAKNKALRCAIIKSHDWQQRNIAFYSGLGTIFPGVITPSVMEFDPNYSKDSITKDIAGAKKLLADAGWTTKNLPVLEYHTSGNVTSRMTFEQFRGFLGQIGYPASKVKYAPYPSFGTFNQALKSGKTPFFSLAWGLDYPDAENTLQLFYGPNKAPGSNSFNYENQEFDELFRQAKILLPSAKRTKLYQQLNKIIIDDCVVLSGLSRNRIYLWHKDVIMYPDREILGGFFARFVALKPGLDKE
ncbi:Dipeptide-binding ABC transporter, periplasmic substrate-binding component (TC 3.A.1.5.2) [hydrothermal vent metagenome]|uniref:Dipeptide-binding ABC transporter, periplasmic substrate-binding component (TC 3.A.1.5.2) n=1 Tax=hydrothermal vent metagenome TaxID=652676 RepID=A0A3B0VK16_9ZZZZ